ncbi:hypothetical protein JHK87_044732 [Glycine soja]|nr:hypothetical protein JHK87_044732 [Glycine soja]
MRENKEFLKGEFSGFRCILECSETRPRNDTLNGCKCYILFGDGIFCIYGSGGILPSQTFPCSLCVKTTSWWDKLK